MERSMRMWVSIYYYRGSRLLGFGSLVRCFWVLGIYAMGSTRTYVYVRARAQVYGYEDSWLARWSVQVWSVQV